MNASIAAERKIFQFAASWRRGISAVLAVAVLALCGIGVSGFASAESVGKAEAVVSEVRVGRNGKATRFVLELSSDLTFRAFVLDNPVRVVIDMPTVGWQLPAEPLPKQVGLLQKFRYGLFKPGTSRVVLDLAEPARIKKAFMLNPSAKSAYRLVVDMEPATAKTFATALKADPIVIEGSGKQVAAPSIIDAPASVPTPSAAPMPTLARVAPPMPTQKPREPGRKWVVALDAGHGGVDPGAIGRHGTYEKHITLNMAKELKRKLEATGRYTVFMTRDRDIFIRLRDRVSKARDAGADVFISLHADTIKNPSIRGLSVYTLSENASDKEAAQLAERENKSDLIAGIDLTDENPEVTNILIDLAQRETMNQSAHFAGKLVRELARETNLLRNTHRFAGFAVLKAPDVPSVLVELGFLSNRTDERNLGRKSYREKLGHAITEAVDAYFTGIEEASRP